MDSAWQFEKKKKMQVSVFIEAKKKHVLSLYFRLADSQSSCFTLWKIWSYVVLINFRCALKCETYIVGWSNDEIVHLGAFYVIVLCVMLVWFYNMHGMVRLACSMGVTWTALIRLKIDMEGDSWEKTAGAMDSLHPICLAFFVSCSLLKNSPSVPKLVVKKWKWQPLADSWSCSFFYPPCVYMNPSSYDWWNN